MESQVRRVQQHQNQKWARQLKQAELADIGRKSQTDEDRPKKN